MGIEFRTPVASLDGFVYRLRDSIQFRFVAVTNVGARGLSVWSSSEDEYIYIYSGATIIFAVYTANVIYIVDCDFKPNII